MVLRNKRIEPPFSLFVALVLFATAALAAPNVPTIDQVYQAARSGHLAQAESMTKDVLRVYPDSARAHYVMAQILAAEGRSSEARTYLEQAKRLKPGLPFASQQSVAKLEQRIYGQGRSSTVGQPSTVQFHWWWFIVGGVIVFLLWRALAGRRTSTAYGDGGMNVGGTGPYPTQPPPTYGGWGGGLFGSILAGLGFGAGAAAGERMVDRFFDRREGGPEMGRSEVQESQSGSGDLGGQDFGLQRGDSSSGGWTDSSSGGWNDSGDQQNQASSSGDDLGGGGSDDGGWDDSSGGGGDVDV